MVTWNISFKRNDDADFEAESCEELVKTCADYLNNKAGWGEWLPYFTEAKVWLSNDYRTRELTEKGHKAFFKELEKLVNFDLDEYARNYNRGTL